MTTALLAPEGGAAPRNRLRLIGTALIAIGIALLAGIAIWSIYRDLDRVIDGRAFGWAVLFALAPVVPLSAAFLVLDRLRPEPAKLQAAALLWGAIGATYVALKVNAWLTLQVGDLQGASPRSAVFIAPWVEETAKAVVIFAFAWWRRHDFNGVLAGVIYGGLAGIGFAFTENIVYYGQVFQQVYNTSSNGAALTAVQHLFFWRGLAAPFVHPMFTMLTGAGVGYAVRQRHLGVRILAPVAGFCAAVLLHMAYNTLASFATGEGLTAAYVSLLLPTVLGLSVVLLLIRRHEHAVVASRLRDYTIFGWLRPAVVPYLCTGRGRRTARRYAKEIGPGPLAAVHDLQRCGIELAVLRDRLVRGVAGVEKQSTEARLIARMRAAQREAALPPDAAISQVDDLATLNSSW